MQHKKIASILSIAALSLLTPLFAAPKANAFHSDLDFQGITGTAVLTTGPDFYPGTVITAGREGSTVNFNVRIVASADTGQRNITVGVKFDWMTSWVNASNANSGNTLDVAKDQYVTVAVGVPLPPLSQSPGLNMELHDWDLRVMSDNENSVFTLGCPIHPGSEAKAGCVEFSGGGFAVYSNDQADGVTAREEAQDKIDALSSSLAIGIFGTPPPGWSKASADISQAQAEIDTGDTHYALGNFNGAKTRYQNVLNLANSAAGALGGGESGNYFASWFGGVGWLLGGVAALLLGFSGFMYLRRRK